jgi:hypothetical protein
MPRGKVENLRPVKTKAEAKKRGSNGGKASGIARREKKLMSQIYGNFLAERHNIKIDGKEKAVTGEQYLAAVMNKVFGAGGAPAVSLMKEIREATEGQKMVIDASLTDLTPAERKKRIAELEAKRAARK